MDTTVVKTKQFLIWLLFVLGVVGCVGTPVAAPAISLASAVDPQVASAPWPMHTIIHGGVLIGADGVQLIDLDGNGRKDVVTAWEQSGIVTKAYAPVCGNGAWLFEQQGGFAGAEDAKVSPAPNFRLAVASDSGQRLYIDGQEVSESLGHGRWMQVAWGDIDGDGLEDLVGLSRLTGGVAAWFKAPSWTYTKISDVGWGMSLQLLDTDADGDLDVFLTDRAKIGTSWALYGARWVENQSFGAVWVNHPISVAGSCPTCTPGDEMMGALVDFNDDAVLDLVHCQSRATAPNRVVIQLNTANWGPPATWTTQVLPNPVFEHGHCQQANAGDLNLDGQLDVVVSAWDAAGASVGVYVLYGPDWAVEDVSGPDGTKYDNTELHDVDLDGDLDIVTSEQVDQLGVIWYENPRV